MSSNKIDKNQQEYWQKKLAEHDENFQAIGSESPEHKALRYERIAAILSDQTNVSVLDVGAGFGDYYGYLQENFSGKGIDYHGTEITPGFCEIAQKKYPGINMTYANLVEGEIDQQFDFVQMSGLFHQHGDTNQEEWHNFMMSMLSKSFERCKKGLSFNVLSDTVDFKREGNFYVDIAELYPILWKTFSRHIIIDQSYPLFETTVHVLKKEFIRQKFSSETFQKYLK